MNMSTHPNKTYSAWHHKSDAAGAYQIKDETDNLAVKHGIAYNFDEASQDKIALWLIDRKGATPYIRSAEYDSAFMLLREPGHRCREAPSKRSLARTPSSSSTTRSRRIHSRFAIPLCRSFVMVAAAPPVRAAPVDQSYHSLRCGGSLFIVTNTYDPDDFIVWQTMDVRRHDGRVFHVDLRNLRVGTTTSIFGNVSSWLCHKPRRHVFVELLYGCNSTMTIADVDRYCRGKDSAEWVRYIGRSGEPLDPGYAIEDPRYDALERRLGLGPETQGETMLPVD